MTLPQSSSDLPLLVSLRDVSHRVLQSLQAPSSPSASPLSTAQPQQPLNDPSQLRSTRETFRIGFITPPWKDNKIPVTDHLHAHGYILPADLLGWWRGVAYSAVAWYDIDDLIAEIRCAHLFSIVGYPSLSARFTPRLLCAIHIAPQHMQGRDLEQSGAVWPQPTTDRLHSRCRSA